MMVPVGRLVVLRVTEKKDLIHAIAYITWPALIAPVLGPPVGGFITDAYSWRWIFYLNVPLGAVAFVLALLWIRNEHEEAARPFDWLGFALAGSACVAFMYSLELLGRQDTAWLAAGVLFGYGCVASWLALRHLHRSEHPLIDFASLKQHTFLVSMRGGTLFRTAIMASPFLLPLMFQVAFGLTARNSGFLVMAMFAGNLMMKSVTTPVLQRYGFRKVLVANGIVSTLVIVACGLLSPGTPLPVIVAVLFLHGLSRSMQFTSVNTLAFVDINKSIMSSATSFSAVVQQMGMGMGVAVGALALRIASFLRGEHGGIPSLMDFHIAFWLVAALPALAVWDYLSLDRHAGAEVSGHAR
jgi:MFS family permease